MYSGYIWEDIFDERVYYKLQHIEKLLTERLRRQQILKLCDVFIDGQFKKDKADMRYPYAGNTNQRVIDVQKSLQKGEIVLWKKK